MDIKGYSFVLANSETKHTIAKYMSISDIQIILNDSSLNAEQARDAYTEYLQKSFPTYDTLFIFPDEKERPIKIVFE